MYFYQVKLDQFEGEFDTDEVYPAKILTHKQKFTQEEFQKFINLAKYDMEHYPEFYRLADEMRKYGFEEIVTGYFE